MAGVTVEGKIIAHRALTELRERVSEAGTRLSLGILVTEENLAVTKFIEYKQRTAKDLGMKTEIIRPDTFATTEDLLDLLMKATKEYDGIVLQLPLSTHYELEPILKLFPLSHDVDVLGHTAFDTYREGALPFHPPVVGAMSAILETYGFRLMGRQVLVVGEGRLVGAPAAIWAKRQGGIVTSVNKHVEDLASHARSAEVLILGAGVPGLVTPDMVKEGVLILDAGTSEAEGVLKGDADPACAEKAALFSPVPGGIGPITVVKIFENLLALALLKRRQKDRRMER